MLKVLYTLTMKLSRWETRESKGLDAQISRCSRQRRLRGWRVLRIRVGEVTVFPRWQCSAHNPHFGTWEVRTLVHVRGFQGTPQRTARSQSTKEWGSENSRSESGNLRGRPKGDRSNRKHRHSLSSVYLPPNLRARHDSLHNPENAQGKL